MAKTKNLLKSKQPKLRKEQEMLFIIIALVLILIAGGVAHFAARP